MRAVKAERRLGSPSVSDEDLWIFIMSTLRYAMGRRSYMTSYTADLIRKYKSRLTEQQAMQIRAEITRELKRVLSTGRTLGDQADHDVWQKLAHDV